MANLKNRMESTLYNMYRQGKGMQKQDDPQHLYIHSQGTLTTYLRQVGLYANWLKANGVKSRAKEAEAAAHIQEYLDDLESQGKRPATIHTAALRSARLWGRGWKTTINP